MEENITNILAGLTIISHIGIALFILIFVFKKTRRSKLGEFFGRKGLVAAFLISLFATLASLYYSDIVGLEPCTPCWYQRIFIYPQVFILGLALYKRDRKVIPYSLLLAIVGTVISIYQVVIQALQVESVTCAINSRVSCEEVYFVAYGYVTIPVLALTAFVLTILSLLLAKKYN